MSVQQSLALGNNVITIENYVVQKRLWCKGTQYQYTLACKMFDYAIEMKGTSGEFDRYSWALLECHSQSDCSVTNYYVCITLSVAVFEMFSLVGIDNSGVQWRSREPDELCKAQTQAGGGYLALCQCKQLFVSLLTGSRKSLRYSLLPRIFEEVSRLQSVLVTILVILLAAPMRRREFGRYMWSEFHSVEIRMC